MIETRDFFFVITTPGRDKQKNEYKTSERAARLKLVRKSETISGTGDPIRKFFHRQKVPSDIILTMFYRDKK